MGLTEAVLSICEANVDHWARNRFDIDEESNDYYDWLTDNAETMADGIFEAIDKAIDEYFDFGNPADEPPHN
jgi:hypothetical protein